MKPRPIKRISRKKHTWGSIFRNSLERGDDHGYAAFLADGWEKRQNKRPNPVLLEQGMSEAGVAPEGPRTDSTYGGNSNSTQAVRAAEQAGCKQHPQNKTSPGGAVPDTHEHTSAVSGSNGRRVADSGSTPVGET